MGEQVASWAVETIAPGAGRGADGDERDVVVARSQRIVRAEGRMRVDARKLRLAIAVDQAPDVVCAGLSSDDDRRRGRQMGVFMKMYKSN